MEEAAEVLDRTKTSRMEILRKAAEKDCAQLCEGMWLQRAFEVIINNNIHPHVFTAALQDMIEHGRRKFKNMVIIPASCGKTFLLAPLEIIFKTFSNPKSIGK